ncbi:MAG TPA: hypothetical protein VK815_14835 [Candidatus Acidoferrales bacterium]|nr:hypothetical protein [Candidatus Acidoferrales bacterium]
MGLDTVELIMAIEEEFNLEIPNETAAKLVILGDIHNYVVQALKQRGETPDEKLIWERLKNIVIKQLGVRPDEVTKSADIVRDLRAD